VPGTVWGTASNRNHQVTIGAVPGSLKTQAFTLPSGITSGGRYRHAWTPSRHRSAAEPAVMSLGRRQIGNRRIDADSDRHPHGIPIDYRNTDFVKEIQRLTGDGVDAVFDGIGGDNLWRSRAALREGGRVVVYGFQSKMSGGRSTSGGGGRHPFRESVELGWLILRNWFRPGRRSMVPYSIQWLMRLRPSWFRQDLLALLSLLQQGKIKPLIAHRLPLREARRAHEMLGEGGVFGKIVLMPNG
jgi:threonine dehydrogenase-like Zn-dependent dehydrogenase